MKYLTEYRDPVLAAEYLEVLIFYLDKKAKILLHGASRFFVGSNGCM
jgi:hypothetical protein